MTVTLSRERLNLRNVEGQVRPRRSGTGPAGRHPTVAVTGAARGIGRALVAQLATSAHVRKVIAIDDHRGDVPGVTWRVADVRDPALASRLAGVDVVVHADLDLRPDSEHRARRAFNVRGAQTVLTSAAADRVGRVILVTSAMVYGARADNAVPLPETTPLAADVDSSVAGDLLEIEQLARRSPRAHPGMELTVVRPAALVGDEIDTIVTRHFEAPRLLTVKGCEPRWQFCHIDDLVSALELAVTGDVTGEFAVGSDGWLDAETVSELSGLRGIELPAGAHLRHRAAPAPGRRHPGGGRRPALRRLPVGGRLRHPARGGLAGQTRQRPGPAGAAGEPGRPARGRRAADHPQGGHDHRGGRGGRGRGRHRDRRHRADRAPPAQGRHRLTPGGTVDR